MPKKVVVGSFVVDLMCRAPHLPKPGATVLGGHFQMGPGGKGAYQTEGAFPNIDSISGFNGSISDFLDSISDFGQSISDFPHSISDFIFQKITRFVNWKI